MKRFCEWLSPDEPWWAVAVQLGFVVLVATYIVAQVVVAITAGRLPLWPWRPW